MAKKKDNVAKEEKSGNPFVYALIVLAIIAIWLVAIGLIIKWDWGGFGSSLRPILQDVPIVNRVLPDELDGELAAQYPYKNMAEAIGKIQELEGQVNQMTESNTAGGSRIAELEQENERLRGLAEDQLAFEERKREFDENVVFNEQAPDPSEYATYYEGIDPDTAAEIYRQIKERYEQDAHTVKQAEQFAKMEPESAASILETMTGDLDLVASLLESMTTTQSALILENMSPEMAAQLTKKRSMTD